jgi:hypothetical protein
LFTSGSDSSIATPQPVEGDIAESGSESRFVKHLHLLLIKSTPNTDAGRGVRETALKTDGGKIRQPIQKFLTVSIQAGPFCFRGRRHARGFCRRSVLTFP